MAQMTVEICAAKRQACPGRRTLPVGVLVTVILALAGALLTSHLLLSAALAETREGAAAGKAELGIRSRQLETINAKLDGAMQKLNRIEACLNGRTDPPRQAERERNGT